MKKTALVFSIVACAALLAGCHHGRNVSFDGHSITLHVDGKPAATITSRGSFSVGPQLVDVSPEQRQLLIRYYHDVVAIHRGTEAVKKAGLAMAGKAVHAVGHSIGSAVGVASASSTTGHATAKAMQDEGQQMQQTAIRLCKKVKQVEQLQTTIAAQVGAFKPYAGIDPAPDVHCG